MSSIIIFDTESTTWEGAMDRGWTGENEYREIVQIGALKVDWPSGEITDSLNILVQPKINPQLSSFFQALTHISQDQVDKDGVSFPEGLNSFLAFCGNRKTYSYGMDSLVLAENVALTHCHPGSLYGMDSPEFINIGPVFHRADPSLKANRINSGRLWQHYNLPKPDGVGEHDALFDCYSILVSLTYLQQHGKITL